MLQYFKHYYRCENKSKYCNYSSAYTAIHNTLFETWGLDPETVICNCTNVEYSIKKKSFNKYKLTYYKFKTMIFLNLLQYIYVFLFVDK